MYTLNKLENMAMLFGTNNIDGILASYFIHSLDELPHMTLQKCMNDTGVSKASLNRFYKKAGFNNFKNFISVLIKENRNISFSNDDYISQLILFLQDYHFDKEQIRKFAQHLLKAKRVMFYGNQKEMECLEYTTNILRKNKIEVTYLNMWEIEMLFNQLKRLKEKDILIIIDTSFNIQNLSEMSISNNYLINIHELRNSDFLKFYIGEANVDNYLGFENVKVPNSKEEYKNIVIEILDKIIAKELERTKE